MKEYLNGELKHPLRSKQAHVEKVEAWKKAEEERKQRYQDYQARKKKFGELEVRAGVVAPSAPGVMPAQLRYNKKMSAKTRLELEKKKMLDKKVKPAAPPSMPPEKEIPTAEITFQHRNGIKPRTGLANGVTKRPSATVKKPPSKIGENSDGTVTLTQDQLSKLISLMMAKEDSGVHTDTGHRETRHNDSVVEVETSHVPGLGGPTKPLSPDEQAYPVRDKNSREDNTTQELPNRPSASHFTSHPANPNYVITHREDALRSSIETAVERDPPPQPMTLTEKKRMQWMKDLHEEQLGFDPFGKPTRRPNEQQPIDNYSQRQQAAQPLRYQPNHAGLSVAPQSKADQLRAKWDSERKEAAEKLNERIVSTAINAPLYSQRQEVENVNSTNNNATPAPTQSSNAQYITASDLNPSKAERLRQKWREELAEERGRQPSVNPGPLNMDTYQRHVPAAVQAYEPPQPPPTIQANPPNYGHNYNALAQGDAGGANSNQVPPAAVRSSFVMGSSTVNNDRYAEQKERERKEWLADLEKQKLEKAAQKARDRRQLEDYLHNPGNPSTTTNYNANNGVATQNMNSQAVYPTASGNIPGGPIGGGATSNLLGEGGGDNNKQHQPTPFSFMGAGKQTAGYEEEHSRVLRHQKATRDKESTLHIAVLEAQAEAERSKLLAKIEKLRKAGHDTSGLERTYADKLSPRGIAPPSRQPPPPNINDISFGASSQRNAYAPSNIPARYSVEPAHIPGLEFSGPSALASYRGPNTAPMTSRGPSRLEEAGVQTDDFMLVSGRRLEDFLRDQSALQIEVNNVPAKKPPTDQSTRALKRLGGATPKAAPPAVSRMTPLNEEDSNLSDRSPRRRAQHKADSRMSKYTEKSGRNSTVMSNGTKPPFWYQNKNGKRNIPASQRDPFYKQEKADRDAYKKERAELMARMANEQMPPTSRLLKPRKKDLIYRKLTQKQAEEKSRREAGFSGPPLTKPVRRRHTSSPQVTSIAEPPPRPDITRETPFVPFHRTVDQAPLTDEIQPHQTYTTGQTDRLVLRNVPYNNVAPPINGPGQQREVLHQLEDIKRSLIRRQADLEQSMTPDTLNEVRASRQYGGHPRDY